MSAYFFSWKREYVGYMDDEGQLFDAYDGFMGGIDGASGQIFGPSSGNCVGYLTANGEMRNPRQVACGYVMEDGTIRNSNNIDIGYVAETDDDSCIASWPVSFSTRVAGAAAWFLGIL